MKNITLAVTVAALLTLSFQTDAQPTNSISDDLNMLTQKVQAKINAGHRSEGDFTNEIQDFDSLVARENGAKTEEAAKIVFIKGMLYLKVFNDFDKCAGIFQQVIKDYPGTVSASNAANVLDNLDTLKEEASFYKKQGEMLKQQEAKFVIGRPLDDFQVKDLKGRPLSIGAFHGKLVLIDFWATWCEPCVAELPNVIAVYKKYHDKGLEVIGVSLDDDEARLNSFLKGQDGMAWPQYFDGKGPKNQLALKYGVSLIPCTVLIGPDGKIIGVDMRGSELEAAITNALPKL